LFQSILSNKNTVLKLELDSYIAYNINHYLFSNNEKLLIKRKNICNE